MQEGDWPKSIDAVRTDGSTEPLTADLAEQIFENAFGEGYLYTYHLRIEAEVIQVAFIPHRKELSSCYTYRAFESTPYSPVRVSSEWPLEPTLYLTADDDLHTALCGQSFDCIVLGNEYGLVVGERMVISKELGESSHSRR